VLDVLYARTRIFELSVATSRRRKFEMRGGRRKWEGAVSGSGGCISPAVDCLLLSTVVCLSPAKSPDTITNIDPKTHSQTRERQVC
jgi:hypothetical protein